MAHKRLIIMLAAVLLIAFWGGSQYESWRAGQPTEIMIDNKIPVTVDDDLSIENESPVVIMVHVTGAVLHSGVYEMQEGDRVEDALQKAGLAENAYADGLNRAALLSDGQKITVPTNDMEEESLLTENDETTDKVSINHGTLTQLMRLNGIGEIKAQAIIDYRERNGGFQSLEDLKKVKGIGEKTYEGLADDIVL